MRRLACLLGLGCAVLALVWLAREDASQATLLQPLLPERAPPVESAARVDGGEGVLPIEPVPSLREGARALPAAERWNPLPEILFHRAEPPGCFLIGRVEDARVRVALPGVHVALRASDEHTVASSRAVVTNLEGEFRLQVPSQGPEHYAEKLRDQWERESRERERERAVDVERAKGKGEPSPKKDARTRRAPEKAPAPTLSLRFESQGYLPHELSLSIDPQARGTHDLKTIPLQPGEVLSGRVLGSLGEGTGPVDVRLLRVEDLAVVASTRTDPRGEYTLPMPLPGAYHIHARAEGKGATVLQELLLPPVGSQVLPDLMLRGEARITGRVESPDGTGLEGVTVVALPAEFDGWDPHGLPLERVAYEEMQGGLFGSSCSSSATGFFDLPYLLAGSYVVYAGGEPEPGEKQVVVAPESSARLAYSKLRLRVRFAGVSVDGHWSPPTLQCVRVVTAGEGKSTGPPLGEPSQGFESGDYFFVLPSAGQYQVLLRKGGETVAGEQVAVAADDYETSVFLRPGSPELAGEPGLSALGSAGEVESVAQDRAEPQASEEEALGGLALFLCWQEGIPYDTPLPAVEAALERVEDETRLYRVEPSWAIASEQVSRPDQGESVRVECSRIVSGRYRLRLRTAGTVFFDQEFDCDANALSFLTATLPVPQEEPASER